MLKYLCSWSQPIPKIAKQHTNNDITASYTFFAHYNSSWEKDMKYYFTILIILFFGFICASCSNTSGVKIAKENFVEDCGDPNCVESKNSKDDFIPKEYLTKKQQEIVEKQAVEPVSPKEIQKLWRPITSSDVLFEFDKFDLKPEGEAIMNKAVGILKKYPSLKLHLSGHTDNKGSLAYNTELSKNRVETGKKYIIEQGIDPARISVSWYSSNKPKASNETPEGRSQNRRIEFEFTKD